MKNKSKLNYLYWSLPILFAINWFLLTLVFTPIYESFFREARVEGLSPRIGMILLSPFILLVLVVLLYCLLYIERKLVYNWNVIIGINVLLLFGVLIDIIKPLIYAHTDTPVVAAWRPYQALEVSLDFIPFILLSFCTLFLIRKHFIIEREKENKDKFYVLFYLLPLLYVVYAEMLRTVLYLLTAISHYSIIDATTYDIIAEILKAGVFAMPVCVLSLWLYKKFGKSSSPINAITLIFAVVFTAFWYYSSKAHSLGNVSINITIVCIMVIPWTVAVHYIAKRYLEAVEDSIC